MNKNWLILGCFLVSPVYAVDPMPEELHLLKSWGFKADAAGQLKFEADVETRPTDFEPWRPDVGDFDAARPVLATPAILDPLVISAKQKREK